MLMKRSMPTSRAMPATGTSGITMSVATRAMNAAPVTPLAPFDVRIATEKKTDAGAVLEKSAIPCLGVW